MKNLKGERVTLSTLSLEDVFFMRNWGKHENPLLQDYNFPPMNDEELEYWYKGKTIGKTKEYFAVYNEEGRMIGYLGMKNIKKIRKEATLGVVFDPNYLNQGYGTEAIKVFIDYFFNQLNMKTLYLDVAKFNKRAIRCYEKCGFQKVKKLLRRFELEDSIDVTSTYFQEEKDSFVFKYGKLYNYIYQMKIDKEIYEEMRE